MTAEANQAAKLDDSVRKTVVVKAPREIAFAVFTRDMTSWWPASHHIGEADMKAAVVEPRAGGRWYEQGADGSECDWGTVLVWEPPERLVLDWQLNAQWQFDPEFHTELEVRFIAEGPDTTRVELEHRNMDRFGDQREATQAALGGEGGWSGIMDRYAEAAAAAK